MQSRSNSAGVSSCTVETMSSDSDLVDITSVSVHRQMYDRCATNSISDEFTDDLYDDDDFDDSLSAGGDNNASRQALLSSAVCTGSSDIPSTNGIVDPQSPSSVDKPAVQVAGKMLPPPFGFPLRSQTEILSRAVELLDSHAKHDAEDCGGNNNSFQHDNAECFKHTINSACHRDDGDITVKTAEAAETCGNVQTTTTPGTNGDVLRQQADVPEASVVEYNSSAVEVVADSRTGFDSERTLHHYTGAAAKADINSISKTRSSKAAGKARMEHKRSTGNAAPAPVTNGAQEPENNESTEVHVSSRPAVDSEVTASLQKVNIPLASSDAGASGDHCEEQPLSFSNSSAEPVSDAEFIAVVRRKRKDAGAKQKAQQSDDLCSFWHRRPARPAPRSAGHHPTGRSSPSQMQHANQKSSNPSGVDLWDSTPAAFPALPGQRVRRNSTGDVPATSESNDDGSDLESVKSMQTSSSRATAWGRSLGTSSYASVVVGNVLNKEPASANVCQSSTSIPQKSPHSDSGLEVSTPCQSDLSTSEEVAVHTSPVEVASFSAGFGSSDFAIDSSVVPEDKSCTDQKIGHDDRHAQPKSSTCSRADRCGHTVLFFDTRSKTSPTTVPSLDISFGFDESLASAAVSLGDVPVTGELQTAAAAPHISQNEEATTVEFLQRSSVDRPTHSSRTSTTSLPRSLFDLRAAQRYLLSAFTEVTESRERDHHSVLRYGTDFN